MSSNERMMMKESLTKSITSHLFVIPAFAFLSCPESRVAILFLSEPCDTVAFVRTLDLVENNALGFRMFQTDCEKGRTLHFREDGIKCLRLLKNVVFLKSHYRYIFIFIYLFYLTYFLIGTAIISCRRHNHQPVKLHCYAHPSSIHRPNRIKFNAKTHTVLQCYCLGTWDFSSLCVRIACLRWMWARQAYRQRLLLSIRWTKCLLGRHIK